jgi:hypothetical protein
MGSDLSLSFPRELGFRGWGVGSYVVHRGRSALFALSCSLLIAIGGNASAPIAPAASVPAPSPNPTTIGGVRIAPLESIHEISLAPKIRRPPIRPAPLFVRGVYGRDSSSTGLDLISSSGFNTVTVLPERRELDRLAAAHMRGVVWLWGYDRSTCAFNRSDAEIRNEVLAIAGHPAILAYQIDDEPGDARTHGCPQVAKQIRQRSALVHALDPGSQTYVVVSTWDGKELYPYQYFAGTTDIMGLDVYPYTRSGSHPAMIDRAIRQARHDGVRRYWAVMQDFSDGYYVVPTAAQIRDELRRWGRSRMEGYFVYHWERGDLEAHPDHLAVYRTAAG